jgi:peroxiredoxin
MELKSTILKIRTLLPEDTYGKDDQVVEVGSRVEAFSLPLATGTDFVLESALKHGPVILNFIKGTWCPYCQLHLKNLREWQKDIVEKNRRFRTTILIVSNEPVTKIREWLKKNTLPYLFASDEDSTVAKLFGVTLFPEEFLKPATFLIDVDGIIRMSFAGRRKEIPLGELTSQTELDKASEEIKPSGSNNVEPPAT